MLKSQPAIAAAMELAPGRFPELRPFDLYSELVSRLIGESNISPGAIDGIFVPPIDIENGPAFLFGHQRLAALMGINPRVAMTMSAGGATFGYMVQNAALSIEAGKAEAVLCIGAGKFPRMNGSSAARYMASSVADPAFEMIYAPVVPALYAQYAHRYMHEHGITDEDMAVVSVAARRWAHRNPNALTYAKPAISKDDVLGSRMIASPFRYLNCSIPCEGGGAVLVTSGDLARAITDQPAYLLGMGESHGHGFVSQNPFLGQTGIATSGSDALRSAGLNNADIDQVQIYDAFGINPLIILEDIGFAPRGRGAELFHSGRALPGGDFPVNTYGGLIGFGHTGDASGMSMIVEAALQVMGRAGGRQASAETCLVHSYGGMMADHSTLIFGRNPQC